MAISEVRSLRPSILLPCMSTMIRSSTCIMPLQTPVGVASMRSWSSRIVMLPSLAATQPFSHTRRPISTMSCRYSLSVFAMETYDCIRGWWGLALTGEKRAGLLRLAFTAGLARRLVHLEHGADRDLDGDFLPGNKR